MPLVITQKGHFLSSILALDFRSTFLGFVLVRSAGLWERLERGVLLLDDLNITKTTVVEARYGRWLAGASQDMGVSNLPHLRET